VPPRVSVALVVSSTEAACRPEFHAQHAILPDQLPSLQVGPVLGLFAASTKAPSYRNSLGSIAARNHGSLLPRMVAKGSAVPSLMGYRPLAQATNTLGRTPSLQTHRLYSCAQSIIRFPPLLCIHRNQALCIFMAVNGDRSVILAAFLHFIAA